MSNYSSKSVDGDLQVRNDVNIGRNVNVRAQMKVNRDLVVGGALISKFVNSANMGLYADADTLNTQQPSPKVGQYAGVGETLPAVLYVCQTAGTWTETAGAYTNDITESQILTIYDTYFKPKQDAHTEDVEKEFTDYKEEVTKQLDEFSDELETVKNIKVKGKFYGYFTSASTLPTGGEEDGFAYVGTNSPYAVYYYTNNTWKDTGVFKTDDSETAADGEDISLLVEDNKHVFRFADRGTTKGEGYVIVRSGKTLASQLTTANTIYEIRYNFDLDGATVTVPAGCTLKFNGGKITNGTLNLNSCDIEGVGINCNITNPKVGNFKLSTFLADTSDTTLNHDVVQVLLDSGVGIIVDEDVTFADYLSVKSVIHIVSQSKRFTLKFPDSRGFVWDTNAYSFYNLVDNINVTSKGHCFDFYNSGGSTCAFNLYQSKFSKMEVTSQEGDCFTAGADDAGVHGDGLCFDNLFEDIVVTAPEGSGFVGISSNTEEFIKVRSSSCGTAVFYNCGGHLIGFNGTWGTTNTFFKGTPKSSGAANRYTLIMDNCNLESFKGVLFDCPSVYCYMSIIMRSCSLYVTPNSSGVVDYFPIQLGVVQHFEMIHTVVEYYNSGTYDSTHALLKVYASNPNIVNTAITYYDNNGYKQTSYTSSKKVYNGVYSTQSNNISYDEFNALSVTGLLKYKARKIDYSDITTDDTLCLKLPEAADGYSVKSPTDTADTVTTLCYLGLPSSLLGIESYIGRKFIIYNANSNTALKFRHNLAYSGRFIITTGSDFELKAGGYVEAEYFARRYGYGVCVIHPVSSDLENKAGSTRPTTNLVNGQMFFDSSLSPARPIWYNGSGWVDSTGATV